MPDLPPASPVELYQPATEEEEEDDSEIDDGEVGEVLGSSTALIQLKDIRKQEKGIILQTEGVVSVPPGVLGDKIMYLAGSGIQLYFYREEYPEIKMGDLVRVSGELTTSLGEYRIKLNDQSDITVKKSGEAPKPHQVQTGEINEKWEGSLVIFEGAVSRTFGNTFYVDDGSGEIKVFIKQSTDIDKPKMKKGVEVTITGVVSRTTTGYRVLPRWQDDVRLGRAAGLSSFPTAGGKSFGAAIVLVVWLWLVREARYSKEPLFRGK